MACTVERKLREAGLALLADRRYPKSTILEAYLNRIYWGRVGSVQLIGVGDDRWSPRNHQRDFKGLVTIREALEKSLNVPAVRVALATGMDHVADTAAALPAHDEGDVSPRATARFAAYRFATPATIVGGAGDSLR